MLCDAHKPRFGRVQDGSASGWRHNRWPWWDEQVDERPRLLIGDVPVSGSAFSDERGERRRIPTASTIGLCPTH